MVSENWDSHDSILYYVQSLSFHHRLVGFCSCSISSSIVLVFLLLGLLREECTLKSWSWKGIGGGCGISPTNAQSSFFAVFDLFVASPGFDAL